MVAGDETDIVPDAGEVPEFAADRTENDDARAGSSRLRRTVNTVWVGLGWLLVAFGAVLLGAASWIRRTFGPISVDQMLMHLPGAGGAETTGAESGYIATFVWQALVLPLVAVAVLVLVVRFIGRWRARRFPDDAHARRGLVGRSFSRTAAALRVRVWVPGLLAVGVFVVGAAVFAQATGILQYVRSMVTPMTMSDYYVVPDEIDDVTVAQMEPVADRKNLVLIYLESVEDLLGDAEIVGSNLLAPVQDATSSWQRIPQLQQYEGGGWTMAGLVGTQCGIPLRGPGIGENDINSNEIGVDHADYLPGAICLGDVLEDNGYTNVFLGGADATFASKEVFLHSHGYGEVKDLRTWWENGEREFSGWGLSDRALMDQAKMEVTRLHDAGQPFNLTMLTLDSHEPAHLFDYCASESEEDMAEAIRCSMEQVADFISYMEAHGYLEDTVVVLTGDHQKMLSDSSSFWRELGNSPDRTIFNRFWSPEPVAVAREEIDQLSLYATMLDLLDLGRTDSRAGVGVSAFVEQSRGSALELDRIDYELLVESRSSDLYRRLWQGQLSGDIQAAE